MPLLHSRRAKALGAIPVAASLAFSLYTIIQTTRLSLPFPLWIPLLTTTLSILCIPPIWNSNTRFPALKTTITPTIIAYIIHLLPILTLIASLTYLTSPSLTSCRLQLQWRHFFTSKDEATIRSIQSLLQCCGFNSMRDQAWPFPSRDVDARTCERTSGFSSPCEPLWRRQMLVVAGLQGGAGVLLLGVVLILIRLAIANPSDGPTTMPYGRPRQEIDQERRSLLGWTAEDGRQETLDEHDRRVASERLED